MNRYQQMDTRSTAGTDRRTFIRGQNRMLNSLTMPEQEKSTKETE